MPINAPRCCRKPRLWLIPAVFVVTACGLALGCKSDQSQKQPSAPPSGEPASPQRISEIREKYRQTSPGAILGPVVDTMPDVRLAAVSDVPLDQFHTGDAVTFINADEQFVDTGLVFDIQPHILAIKYDAPGAKGRAPQVGDIMVRLPPPRGASDATTP